MRSLIKSPARALGLLLLILLVVRPAAYGVAPGSVAVFWAFVLLAVGVPGVLLCWAAGLYRQDPALLLGQGLTLGLALQGLLFVAGRVVGLEGLPYALPFLALGAAALVAGRRKAGGEPRASSNADPRWLLLMVLLGCFLQPLVTLRLLGDPLPVDLLYHAGNAAEVRHRWPLEDPRVAGLPLNYPVLAYAIPVVASRLGGLPVADGLHGLATLFWIGLLALQTHNAGRVLLGDLGGATLGTLVVLLHEDVGGFLGLGRGAFFSNLATALYGSPTTVCGLILFAGIAIAVAEMLDRPRPAVLFLLFVLALAGSLTKATVVPPAAGGCLLLSAWAWVKRRPASARTALLCAVVLGIAAAPFTLRLGAGKNSYGGILRWDPGAIVRQSPFTLWAARTVGLLDTQPAGDFVPPPGLVTAIAPVWFLGYLGLAGVGALAFLWRRREPLRDAQLFALGVLLAGLLPALLLDGHGLSQLFFLYNGQLLLGVLAGGGLVSVLRRRPHSWVLLTALGLAALPSLDKAGRFLWARPAEDYAVLTHERNGVVESYAAGLAWLRTHAARDAVVFADNPSLLLSAFGEVRMYYETGLFTPRGWEERWKGTAEPFPEKASFQEELLRRPDPAAVTEARRLFPPPVRVLVVADNVQSRIDSGFLQAAIGTVPGRPLLSPRFFRLVFANPALHVYRLDGEPAPESAARPGE